MSSSLLRRFVRALEGAGTADAGEPAGLRETAEPGVATADGRGGAAVDPRAVGEPAKVQVRGGPAEASEHERAVIAAAREKLAEKTGSETRRIDPWVSGVYVLWSHRAPPTRAKARGSAASGGPGVEQAAEVGSETSGGSEWPADEWRPPVVRPREQVSRSTAPPGSAATAAGSPAGSPRLPLQSAVPADSPSLRAESEGTRAESSRGRPEARQPGSAVRAESSRGRPEVRQPEVGSATRAVSEARQPEVGSARAVSSPGQAAVGSATRAVSSKMQERTQSSAELTTRAVNATMQEAMRAPGGMAARGGSSPEARSPATRPMRSSEPHGPTEPEMSSRSMDAARAAPMGSLADRSGPSMQSATSDGRAQGVDAPTTRLAGPERPSSPPPASERPALWRRMVQFRTDRAAPELPRGEATAGFVREVTRWPCRGSQPPMLSGRGLELPGPGDWRAAWTCLYGHVDEDMCERAAFLDLESTGLGHGSGTVAFVVGLATPAAGGWQIEQWVLSQLSAEAAMLADLAERLRGLGGPLVTFNGASFDLPLLRGRLRRCGLGTEVLAGTHLDLLPVARRLWRGRGPDCRLTTLERTQLGVWREGDIAGRAIPEVFWAALREPHDARARQAVRRVAGHNLVDVLTMPALAGAMARTLVAPGDADLERRAADHRNAIGRRLRKMLGRNGVAGAPVDSMVAARAVQDPLPRRVAHLGP